MDQAASLEIRMEDYLVISTGEKALQSTTEGVAQTLNIYVIATAVGGVVFDKSLAQLW